MHKFLFFMIFFVVHLLGDSTSITINDDTHFYDDFELSYYKEQSATLDIQEVSNKAFKEFTPNKFALGYTKGDVWMKFDVQNNSSDEKFILSLGESFYEKANLYYYDKEWVTKQNSLFTLLKEREVNTNHLSFEVDIPKGKTKTLYLQLQGKYAYFGNITLSNERYFYQNLLLGINALYIAILGIIFIIVVLNSFLFFKTKENTFLYYVGYSFFNFIYISNISGLLVFLDLQFLIYKLQSSAALMIGFLIIFSATYFNTKKYLPRLSPYIYALALPSFFFAVMVLFSYQPWNKYINNYAGIISILLIVISIIVYLKGHKKAKYYIFAISLYFIFVVLFTFMVTGLLEYSFATRYGFVLASVIEIIIFSLMLASRFYDMREEVIVSQGRLLKIKETNEKLLEKKVEERTTQLQQRYIQIENLLGERDMLLKEVHHRVKNNFHTIIGLLWMEEQKDEPDTKKFENIRNRIKSMSMIHEKLYNSQDINNISLKTYINDIAVNLLQSPKSKTIDINQRVEDITMEFDYAISLGIILNEVISNSIKHNANNPNLDISIMLDTWDKDIKLVIEDNGTGFKKDNSSNGLGLSLIESFANKLPHSDYSYQNDGGTTFTLEFERGKND